MIRYGKHISYLFLIIFIIIIITAAATTNGICRFLDNFSRNVSFDDILSFRQSVYIDYLFLIFFSVFIA
jgi:hypothetical protein